MECFSGGAFPLERGLQRSFREKAFVWFFLGESFWLLAGRMSLERDIFRGERVFVGQQRDLFSERKAFRGCWTGFLEVILKHCIFPGRVRVFEAERELTIEGHSQVWMLKRYCLF